MKRATLILPPLLTLVLAGIALVQAGWFSRACPAPGDLSRLVHPPRSAAEPNPLSAEAIQRWRSNQPHHWRGWLLRQ